MTSLNETSPNSGSVVRIALDAMGGDYGPPVTVPGALAALDVHPEIHVTFVGDPDQISSELKNHRAETDRIAVVPSEGKISDDEHPVAALRRRPRSSISVTTHLLKSGAADMAVSVGSTGATMAASVFALGLMEGLERPCIGGNFLGLAPDTTVIDLGSNVDCRPPQMVSFAALGVAFSRHYLGIQSPRVALLSVGEEAAKGNRQVQDTFTLLEKSHLNFVGNVEGMDFFTDKADVIVCDGFIGNILIKFAEGLGSVFRPFLQRQLASTFPEGAVTRITDAIWQSTNLPRTMGGPLFGINGLVMIGHGSSGPEGISGAIETGLLCHRIGLVNGFRQELSRLDIAIMLESGE